MELKPKRITIEITNLCNLSCEMCFLTGFNRKNIYDAKPKTFFPLNLFKKILDEIAQKFMFSDNNAPFSLILTGGEVFLHPDFFEMLSYTAKKGIGATVFTNGTLIDENLAVKIMRCKPEALMFSLDGPEESHDALRGKGNFRKTHSAINLIQKLKKESGETRPKIFVNTLIHNLNVDQLEDFMEICEKLKIDGLSLSHIQWSIPGLTSKIQSEFKERLNWTAPLSSMAGAMEHDLYVKEKKMEQLLRCIESIKKNHLNKHSLGINIFPNLSPEETRMWYSPEMRRIDFCDDVREWIRIGANGDIYPVCAMVPYSWGNLKEQSLEEILRGDRIKKFFSEIRTNGLFYACQRCCRRPAKSRCA